MSPTNFREARSLQGQNRECNGAKAAILLGIFAEERRYWRCLTASNRQTPVATETFRLSTDPAIGNFTKKSQAS